MNPETQSQLIPSFQEFKEQYKNRLEQILYKEPTVENMETFADDALGDLVALNEDILLQYRTNPSFEPNKPDPLFNEREQEDDAYKKLELPDIQEILERVGEVKTRIDSMKDYITHHKQFTERVMTPPIKGAFEIRGGSGEGVREPKFIPRLLTLMYLLETDLCIEKEAINITEGKVTEEMMRREPYVRVEIPDLQRAVYICNEEGNASYVFNTEKLEQLGIKLDELDIDDKRDKNSLIAMHPGIGMRIIQTKHWRKYISETLSADIPKRTSVSPDTIEEFERRSSLESKTSEFTDKRKWPNFEDFQAEVRAVYEGESNVLEWYRAERKKHEDWPSNPNMIYANKGWIGLQELVGKTWPAFENFQAEVRAVYAGESNVTEWYKTERKKHEEWPANPQSVYAGEGWNGLQELVGNNWPLYENFQAEVRAAYAGESDIAGWYKTERKKHEEWPGHPEETYLNKGWLGLSELVGKENLRKREWLPYENLQAEVRALYNGETDVKTWYTDQKKTHENWHSSPDRYYKDRGWIGWPEFVGNENPRKKEWPVFEDFQAEIKAVYKGESDVKLWYRVEKEKHNNWPTSPQDFYEDEGWIGWSELVGKENPKKKEWLSYKDFQAEVRAVYAGESDVLEWYQTKRKTQKKWPSVPNVKYKGEGWLGWSELVGKENPKKKEWLSYKDFQAEVKAAYAGENDVKDWYDTKRTERPNWPSNPNRLYKNDWKGYPSLVGR